jgi:adenylate cyclase
MRLMVKRSHTLINDLKFMEGPVYIGRQPQSQVFLPDRAVSRQHAVIYTTPDGGWMIKDLESANQTVVNNRAVATLPLHEGDVIRIGDFSVEVHLDQYESPSSDSHHDATLDLGDTLIAASESIPSVYGKEASRKPEHMIQLVPARIKDLYELMIIICRLDDQETLLVELTKILLDQFEAYHVWAGFRETTEGALTCHGGITRGGSSVTLNDLVGRSLVKQAMKGETYVLLPNIVDAATTPESTLATAEHLRSAMAAPIMAPTGAYGVIYIDNGCDQAAYSQFDLDYLTLISTHVAALVEHIG